MVEREDGELKVIHHADVGGSDISVWTSGLQRRGDGSRVEKKHFSKVTRCDTLSPSVTALEIQGFLFTYERLNSTPRNNCSSSCRRTCCVTEADTKEALISGFSHISEILLKALLQNSISNPADGIKAATRTAYSNIFSRDDLLDLFRSRCQQVGRLSRPVPPARPCFLTDGRSSTSDFMSGCYSDTETMLTVQ